MTLRVLVTVSRSYREFGVMNEALAAVFWEFGAPRDAVLVSGHCRKGDQDAERIWRAHGLRVEPHPARWNEHAPDCPARHTGQAVCRKAGFRRDAEMVALGATACLAFIGPCVDPKCERPKPHSSHGAIGTARMATLAGIDTRPFIDPVLQAAFDDRHPINVTLPL